MPTSSQKTRNQQFGLKLLVIVVIVVAIFTVWYLAEKNNRTAQAPAPIETQSVVN